MGEDRFEEIRKLSDELRDKGLRCSHCCRFWVHTDCKCYIFGKSYPGPAKCVYYLKKELERRQNSGKKGVSMKILTEIEKYVNAFPLGIDPCGMCENKDKIKGHSYDVCRSCCYYYASNFKIKGNKK